MEILYTTDLNINIGFNLTMLTLNNFSCCTETNFTFYFYFTSLYCIDIYII